MNNHSKVHLVFLKSAYREFSDVERARMGREERKMFRAPLAKANEPAERRLASPDKRALLAALLAGGYGATMGGLVGQLSDNSMKGALIGGSAVGLPAYLLAKHRAKATNGAIEEAMSEMNPGATLRDLGNNPTYYDRFLPRDWRGL
jgi:hypothetical protein